MGEVWSAEKFLDALGGLRMWSRGEERAPHKPLLLLLALAELQHTSVGQLHFSDVESRLRDLLDQFGPPRPRNNPVYPFWRLQNDGFWQVLADGPLKAKANREPTVAELRAKHAKGQFIPDVLQLFAINGELLATAAQLLLDEQFPPSLHTDILSSVGLVVDTPIVATRRGRRRDPNFARAVLQAYEYRCGVCGYDGQLANKVVALEAAHVKWFAFGGPDSVDNGVGLCSIHHKALDMGAIGISPERTIVVSQAFRGAAQWQQFFAQYSGRRLLGPQPGQPSIASEFQAWHFDQVFRRPARPSSLTSEPEDDSPQQAT